MSPAPFDPCVLAVERYKGIARWRNLWTILLFVFGLTVIVFLCGAILLFINQSWLPGALSTLGTIVNGVGVSWVVTRRGEAVTEEAQAYDDVKSVCGGAGPGPSGAGPAAPKDFAGGGAMGEIERFRQKLLLFGLFR